MGRPPPGGESPAIQLESPLSFTRAACRVIRAVTGPGSSRRANEQRGVTGLETAIIMIAFMVVASVFAMTTLQVGLFSASQGEEVAYSGLDQATGSLELHGSVRAVRGDVDVDGNDTILLSGVDDQAVVKLVFTVTGVIEGSLADLTPPHTSNDTGIDPDASGLTTRASITVQTDNLLINDAAWSVTFPGSDNGDYFLDSGERAELTVWLHTYDNVNSLWDLGGGSSDPYVDAASDLLGVNMEFTLQLHLVKGVTLNIQRSTPDVLRARMDLR